MYPRALQKILDITRCQGLAIQYIKWSGLNTSPITRAQASFSSLTRSVHFHIFSSNSSTKTLVFILHSEPLFKSAVDTSHANAPAGGGLAGTLLKFSLGEQPRNIPLTFRGKHQFCSISPLAFFRVMLLVHLFLNECFCYYYLHRVSSASSQANTFLMLILDCSFAAVPWSRLSACFRHGL